MGDINFKEFSEDCPCLIRHNRGNMCKCKPTGNVISVDGEGYPDYLDFEYCQKVDCPLLYLHKFLNK